jgi:enterochelin esterase family protein
MSTGEPTISPQIEALRQAIEAGNARALVAFWDEVAERGAPLIEPLAGDDEHSLVTFVWRGGETRGVALISLLTSAADREMARLPNTDLWYKTCRVRNDVRATYQYDPDQAIPSSEGGAGGVRPWANRRPDPLNPKTFSFFDEETQTGIRLVRSVLEMPSAPAQPWTKAREEVPKGTVEAHCLRSEVLDNERDVWVYTPADYVPKGKRTYPLLLLFDGWGYVKLMPTATILDNLISARRILPLVAVLLDSASLDQRVRELLFCQTFNTALVSEFVPWVRARYDVTDDPEQIVVGGASAGGLAAAYAGLEYPEVFGNVLSQSGAFRLAPPGETEYEWLARQFAERERLPLQFYLDAGTLETNSLRDLGDGPSLLVSNRHMRSVLRAKGYTVHYAEFAGGHDYISWQGTISDGLEALLGRAERGP